MRAIARGDDPGDLSSLKNPEAIDRVAEAVPDERRPHAAEDHCDVGGTFTDVVVAAPTGGDDR